MVQFDGFAKVNGQCMYESSAVVYCIDNRRVLALDASTLRLSHIPLNGFE